MTGRSGIPCSGLVDLPLPFNVRSSARLRSSNSPHLEACLQRQAPSTDYLLGHGGAWCTQIPGMTRINPEAQSSMTESKNEGFRK